MAGIHARLYPHAERVQAPIPRQRERLRAGAPRTVRIGRAPPRAPPGTPVGYLNWAKRAYPEPNNRRNLRRRHVGEGGA